MKATADSKWTKVGTVKLNGATRTLNISAVIDQNLGLVYTLSDKIAGTCGGWTKEDALLYSQSPKTLLGQENWQRILSAVEKSEKRICWLNLWRRAHNYRMANSDD